MKMTHLEAKEALIRGDGTEAAWRIAQADEGLKPGTTKRQWLRWMSALIEAELQADAAAKSDPIHY